VQSNGEVAKFDGSFNEYKDQIIEHLMEADESSSEDY